MKPEVFGLRCGVTVDFLAGFPHEYRFQVPDQLREPSVPPDHRSFVAMWAAEAFLKERGFRYGPSQAGAPRAIWAGDCHIEKWRNIDHAERATADGVIITARGNQRGRGGDIVLRMKQPLADGPTFQAIEPARWGEDHLSTLLYIETVCVDFRGAPKLARLRVDPDRHGCYIDRDHAGAHGQSPAQPTRLAGGAEIVGHDDWDCIEDAEAAGLLLWGGEEDRPAFAMTPRGLAFTAAIRAHKAGGPRGAPRVPLCGPPGPRVRPLAD